MKKRKLIINFTRYSVEVFIEMVRFIIIKMTGNTNFTTPDPKLVDLEALTDDLDEKCALAKSGDRQAHIDMIASRNRLEAALHNEALYVERIGQDDEAILVSSGFPLTKDPSPAKRKSFWLMRGPNASDVLAGCSAYPKARAYVWQRYVGANPPADANLWIWTGVSTQAKMGLTDLDPASRVWLRYCAVTKNGMMEWSNPIDIIVG